MVRTKVPRGVLLRVLTVRVELFPPVLLGLNEELVRLGNPLMLNVTAPVNPLVRATLMAYVVPEPRLMVRLEGVAEIVKSGGGGGAVTVTATVVEWVLLPSFPVTVTV
jgi:hypothetical protein